MTRIAVAVAVVVLNVSVPLQLPLERSVQGQTLTSHMLPAVDIVVNRAFVYVGAQRVTLSGVADAELHLFARTTSGGVVQAFYWFQFERYLPGNDCTYEIGSTKTLDVDGMSFFYDTLGYSDFAGIQRGQPGSDGAAAVAILDARKLAFPRKVARVRLFHFPDAQRRHELMIIYGEELSPVVPTEALRFPLDAPAAGAVIAHFRAAITLHQR